MMNLALLAPPGGGKGTQSEKIKMAYNIPHVSTGDIFRAIVKGNYKGNYPVQDILKYMNSGSLVPDDIVIGIVLERLNETDCENGYLLDGFPRTRVQADLFDKEAGRKALNKVILIEVNQDDLFKRLTGRRSCPKCGRIYNVYFTPSKREGYCDFDGEKLVIRSDDEPETVKKRLEVYEKETAPLIDYYKGKGILKMVNGNLSVEEVFKQIMEVLRS